MGYVGSYIWKIRQKVGNETLLTVTVDVVVVDKDGRLKMVYVKHVDSWAFVGGHAELGDSFQSAALHELEEEIGFLANKDDLELIATLSGGGRISQYKDGNTQPMTLVFLCRNWHGEKERSDAEEVAKDAWFSIDEVKKLNISANARFVLDAYEGYLRDGKVQMIEVDELTITKSDF